MTNFSEVFNNVLKGSLNVPITAYVQLTFYRFNDYFLLRRKSRSEDFWRWTVSSTDQAKLFA